MNSVQISVCLGTYNRAKKLRGCLDNLYHQSLPQDQYEVIVVDDGSVDETEQVLQDFAKRYTSFSFIKQQNMGPATARNQAARKARAAIIAFTDDDCLVPSDWLEALLRGFKDHPEVAGVGGYQEAGDDVLQDYAVARFERFQTREFYGGKEREVVGDMEVPGVVTNNMAIKREVFWENGGFDETFPVAAGEDADLKKRITDQGSKLLYIPLKVIHRQNYDLRSFLRQSFFRGIGSRHFQRKWNTDVSNRHLLVWLVSRPWSRFWLVLTRSKSATMGSLAFLQEAMGLWGQIRYEKVVGQRR